MFRIECIDVAFFIIILFCSVNANQATSERIWNFVFQIRSSDIRWALQILIAKKKKYST